MTTAPRMGEVVKGAEFLGRRDAFHVPGILVHSVQELYPGESVRFMDSDLTQVVGAALSERHAIVDPFLNGETEPGKLFWVLPIPGATSNLQHRFDVAVQVDPEYTFDRNYRGEGEPGYATDADSEAALECKGCY
jgi:hypothetical protein